jgi:hypothetical protein
MIDWYGKIGDKGAWNSGSSAAASSVAEGRMMAESNDVVQSATF